jgi:hypothetical protein
MVCQVVKITENTGTYAGDRHSHIPAPVNDNIYVYARGQHGHILTLVNDCRECDDSVNVVNLLVSIEMSSSSSWSCDSS